MNFQDLKQQSKVHFIGIGGIGMSALALVLREFNIDVQGSDLSENYLTEKLREKGVKYIVGHDANNISDDVSLIVQTSIIKTSNPEIQIAQEKKIPIITRAELLAIVMKEYKPITIAGTHGKTSTTGMVALMLEFGDLDPTVINGGVIHHFGSNSKIGQGEYLIAESDESDASFINLPSYIGAVTNIEPEHLDFAGYAGCFEKQKACFEQYISQIPADGMCAICIDSPEVEKIYEKLKSQKNNLVTYSTQKSADLRAQNIKMDAKGTSFDVIFKDGREMTNITMPTFGKHNVSNALVAIAIADFLKLQDEQIKKALLAFSGVKRRFTKVGEYEGAIIIDDYGHHPTEIVATLESARVVAGKNNVICIFQPHKYSRLRDAFDAFCNAFSNAQTVIIADVFAAGQDPIEGARQDDLIAGIQKSGHQNVIKLDSEKELAKIIKPLIHPGDVIFFTGAGNITYWAANLEEQLRSA
jgi:UDP-N-acetylmuramate--alanine ligase